MKKYSKPTITILDNIAEGVYAASGCYNTTAYITQSPQEGRGNYCIQVDAKHDTNHHSNGQVLTLVFNQPVTYSSSAGQLVGGDNTNVLKIQYNYHSNETENIGLGNIYVISEAGLANPTATLSCEEVSFADCPMC